MAMTSTNSCACKHPYCIKKVISDYTQLRSDGAKEKVIIDDQVDEALKQASLNVHILFHSQNNMFQNLLLQGKYFFLLLSQRKNLQYY